MECKDVKDIYKFISIHNERTEESEANAHLISAAPDMYKIIEVLLGEVSELNQGYEERYSASEASEKAELILKKARGE